MRRVHFDVAKRYMNMKRSVFMTCMYGDGWILYKDKDQPIARVTHTPKTQEKRDKYCFWGNWWQNPSRL